MTKTLVTKNENETMLVGEELAKEFLELELDRSIVIFLQGELGAGKTTLTKGILKGLNYDEVVTSPTYNLVQIHETENYRVFHFDLYRISEPIELEELGIEEYLNENRSLSIFEWPRNGEENLPSPDYLIEISYKENGENDNRKLTIS